MRRMRVGTEVVLENRPEWGTGKIVAVQSRYQTVLVKWDAVGECRYHIPWVLKEKK